MTRRMIDSGMWSNENFAALPAMARLLQVGVINHADDQGRIKAHPAYLRSQIFPYDDVTIDDVQKWLKMITQNGTAIVYEVDGKDYLQLAKWWDYQSLQYASPSEYPAPTGWHDRIRYNAKGGAVLTHNWITVKGDALPDTCDSRGNPVSYSPVIPPSDPPENPPGPPPGSINHDQLNTNKDQDQSSPPTPHPGRKVDDEEFGAVIACWQDNMPGTITPILQGELEELVAECTGRSVIHGITVALEQNKRFFKYVASVARNHASGKEPPGRKAQDGGVSDAKKSAIITRAATARTKIRTAEQFGGYIDPTWLQDIESAKGFGPQ